MDNMQDEIVSQRVLLDFFDMQYKIKNLIAEAKQHKDNGHHELHTDWIINNLKKIIE